MTIPGFTAEISVDSTSRRYRQAGRHSHGAPAGFTPQDSPAQVMCEGSCQLDYGRCDQSARNASESYACLRALGDCMNACAAWGAGRGGWGTSYY